VRESEFFPVQSEEDKKAKGKKIALKNNVVKKRGGVGERFSLGDGFLQHLF
jgi:hypothetical protein